MKGNSVATPFKWVSATFCFNGRSCYYLIGYESIGNGFVSACRIDADTWGRKQAKEALDVLENVYGLERKRIRFKHR